MGSGNITHFPQTIAEGLETKLQFIPNKDGLLCTYEKQTFLQLGSKCTDSG